MSKTVELVKNARAYILNKLGGMYGYDQAKARLDELISAIERIEAEKEEVLFAYFVKYGTVSAEDIAHVRALGKKPTE